MIRESLIAIACIAFIDGCWSQYLNDKLKTDLRLPKSILPIKYELRFIPFIWEGNFTFDGEMSVVVKVMEDTTNVTLHALDLKIDERSTSLREYSASHGVMEKLTITDQSTDIAKQFYIIQSKEALRAGNMYWIHLKFVGTLNDRLVGFYRSSYTVDNQTRWIATTQFQATGARQAFPCFDEPAFKAIFQINIARPKNLVAISNMPRDVEYTSVVGLPNYTWDKFKDSVPMSTYLVAFTVSDFAAKMTQSKRGTLIGIWTRKEAIDQVDFALRFAPKILDHFENYFNVTFPLPKIDMIAIPDFDAGAMENWGLITYRDSVILYKEGVSTRQNKQVIATIIAHELAHQWFGNLVTPSWWSDLWLNEGFATYVGEMGVDAVVPEWKVLEQFVANELQDVFVLDALKTTHPISTKVDDPYRITELFDRISYGKGASILRMMDNFITNDVLKRGLTKYLLENSYQNAEQDDLWLALTKQAHEDGVLDERFTVKEIMDSWTLQSGFPAITVTRDYEKDSAFIVQEQFLSSMTEDTTKTLWWIPLTYTTAEYLNFNSTKPMIWMEAERHIKLEEFGASPNDWVIFNILETGYYRVNYDKKNWKLLINQLNGPNFKDIPTINRAQLVDDALSLAQANCLDYATALDVTNYLIHETEYLPWTAALMRLSYLDKMLANLPSYGMFRAYVLRLLENFYDHLGFEDRISDSQLQIINRANILARACLFGKEECVYNAVSLFAAWKASPDPDRRNPIAPNLKSVVYCTAIRMGGQAEWDFAWERYKASNISSEQNLLLTALGCTREMWILNRYLHWSLSSSSGIRKQDILRVVSTVSNNPIGQQLTFNFLRKNWVLLSKILPPLTQSRIIEYAFDKITSKYMLKDLIDFVKEYETELKSVKRAVNQAINKAEANILWISAKQADIEDWLTKNSNAERYN